MSHHFNFDVEAIYSRDLPSHTYTNKTSRIRNPELPLRKQLLSIIEFLTIYWEPEEDKIATLLYIGSTTGVLFPVLLKLFTNLRIVCYNGGDNERKYQVEASDNLLLFNRDINDEEIEEYKGNVFLVLDVKNYVKKDFQGTKEEVYEKINSKRIVNLILQKEYYEKIKPIEALLTFTLPYPKSQSPETFEYLNGTVYFCAWNGNHSTETKLVPIYGSTKKWDLIEYESILFYRNEIDRKTRSYSNEYSKSKALDPPELTTDFDSNLEIAILGKYCKKLDQKYDCKEVIKSISQLISKKLGEKAISTLRPKRKEKNIIHIDIEEIEKYLIPDIPVYVDTALIAVKRSNSSGHTFSGLSRFVKGKK